MKKSEKKKENRKHTDTNITDPINEIIQIRKFKAVLSAERKSLLFKIFLIAAIFFLVFTFVFGVKEMKGRDMQPAVKNGDIIIYSRILGDIDTGDILVFSNPKKAEKGDEKSLVSRAGAVKHSEIDKTNGGELLIDGRIHPVQKDRGLYYTTYVRKEYAAYPITLSDNEYFLLSDKRDTSIDSRTFGPVKRKDIKGKVFLVIRKGGF